MLKIILITIVSAGNSEMKNSADGYFQEWIQGEAWEAALPLFEN